MSELQPDEITPKSEELETAEGGAELAPATGEPQDKTEDGTNENVQKAINKQHAKYREEERLKIAAQNEAKELKEKLAAFEAEKGDIIIPEMPDSFDEDFDAKLTARDDAIKRKATQDAQQKNIIEQQNATQEAANIADQEHIQSLINDYDKRIVTLGLDVNTVKNAGNKVIEYGISGDLAEFIMQQEDGPFITQYLAENPIQVDELRNMPIAMAAIKISSDIKKAASAMKPQASNAPDPAETLSGRGAGEQKNPLIAGATFE